jgi:high-affinity Fe2+/Pb2+ permease
MRRTNRTTLIATITLLLALAEPACVFVGGYRSGGGWFFFPGGIGVLLVIVILFLLLRRRR